MRFRFEIVIERRLSYTDLVGNRRSLGVLVTQFAELVDRRGKNESSFGARTLPAQRGLCCHVAPPEVRG